MERSSTRRKKAPLYPLFSVVLVFGSFSCSKKQEPAPDTTAETNPFFTEWTTPFGTPPFPEIKETHYMPAFQEGMARQKKEGEAMAASAEPPIFANTVEGLE